MKRILIADDDNEVLELMESAFIEEFPYIKIDIASNGKSAFKKYKDNKPDLVISDYKMPEVTGLELLAAIRKFDRCTLFYLHTGSAEIDQDETMRKGATDVVYKGGKDSVFELVDRVKEYIAVGLEVE